jgi:hypothetical protein
MIETKHTPPPWEIAPRKARYRAVDEAPLLAVGLPVEFEAWSVGTAAGSAALIPCDESSFENAILVRAAPELLQALRNLVTGIERAASAGIDLSGYVGTGKALAIIAKVTGDAR